MPYIKRPNTVDFLLVDETLTRELLLDWFGRPNTNGSVLYDSLGNPGRIKAWDSSAGFVFFDLPVGVGRWVIAERNHVEESVEVYLDNWNSGPEEGRYVEDPYNEES